MGQLKNLPEGHLFFYAILYIILDNTPNMVYALTMTGKDVVKMLKNEKWEIKRITGSHYIMKKDGYRLVPVPYHSKELKIGLLKAISKQTGVKLP